MSFSPPPHTLLHEPLDDKETRKVWNTYISKYDAFIEAASIDAAEVCSVEEFSKQFEIFVTAKSSKRIKLLMVWHAHFLSLACQQSLRRWLETKSYRCRVWFHVEYLNNIQSALLSRCILTFIPGITHTIPTVHIENRDSLPLWKGTISENELRTVE
jgi:DNA polymerase III delta prime subunit